MLDGLKHVPDICPSACSDVGSALLRGVVVLAGHGIGGTHPHPGPGLHAAAAWTQQQVQGMRDRCVALMLSWCPSSGMH